MNSKLLKRLFIATLVTCTVVLLIFVINSLTDTSIRTESLFQNLKLQDVSSFEYILPDKDLLFTKKSTDWYVNDYLASNKNVEIAISKLLSIQTNYIASTDSTNFALFGVNNNKSKIVLKTKDKTLEFFVGKNTFESGSFIRLANTNKTIGSDISINSILDNDIGFFRDKTITRLDFNLIKNFSVGNNYYSLQSGQWYKNNLAIAKEKISTLVAFISNIEGIAFADNADVGSIKTTPITLNVKIDVGVDKYNFDFINYKENLYIKDSNKEEYLIGLKTDLEQIQQLDSQI